MSEITKLVDFELAEDLQEFIKLNPDVVFDNLDIKKSIEDFAIGTLVKVDKEIGSQIKVISVEEVTEQVIANMG